VTRLFLRTAEFLWQEGHTAHATEAECQEEVLRMLDVYRDFAETELAIPVHAGRKSESEKFAGASMTYSIEALMRDGKALQAGTSHNLGQHFSKSFGITYQSREGREEYGWQTSWGVTTRLIGALVMVHGDQRGLVLPPKVAPIEVVILPIAAHKPGVAETCLKVRDALKAEGIRVYLDDRDTVSAGWKFNEWELKGVPLRLEIGPRDIENSVATALRRDTLEKFTLPLEGIGAHCKAKLEEIQRALYDKAMRYRDAHTFDARTMEELIEGVDVNKGYVRAMWCGDRACEDAVKERTSATARCMPFEQQKVGDKCVVCGKEAKHMVFWARAYRF
jgi:prolyl-tRNA synthetase